MYLLGLLERIYYHVYDDLVLNLEPYTTYMVSVAKDLSSLNKGLSIVDLGYGTGNLIIFLYKQNITIKSLYIRRFIKT